MKLNINDKVKVQLTDFGRAICQWDHIKMTHVHPGFRDSVYIPPAEDEGGWSEWQLWKLMEMFGEHMHMGLNVPFHTTMKYQKPK